MTVSAAGASRADDQEANGSGGHRELPQITCVWCGSVWGVVGVEEEGEGMLQAGEA
ncbi:hypothetical protein M2167_006608 [Streptomyces sp. SPB4]|nr:hypothetical protein [Streptomyces sp. SPB4]